MGQMKNKFGFNIIHVVCTQVSFKLSGSFIEGIQTFTSLFYRYDRTTFPRKKRCLVNLTQVEKYSTEIIPSNIHSPKLTVAL